MPARKPSTVAPHIDPLVLENLTPGDSSDLRAGGTYEGLTFDSVNLDEAKLPGIVFSECELSNLSAHDCDFRAARFIETAIHRLNAPAFKAPYAHLREVHIHSSRLGSIELYESDLQSVHFVGCKLTYLNLRGARVNNVLFTDCSIDELDVGRASVTRLAFEGTDVRSLDVTQATLVHADLRTLQLSKISGIEGLKGATLTELQAAGLAALLAAQLGIKIENPIES